MTDLKRILIRPHFKRNALLLVTLSLLALHWFGHPAAEAAKGIGTRKAKLVPAALLKWPEGGAEYAILVEKSSQKVFVYHRSNLFKPVKVYTGSTGENDGPKTRQNDRKTPEGIYFFTKSYEEKDLAPIYGIRAFPIDYPNPIDRREGRSGYGIWFHGLNKPLKPRDTNGCIAFENHNIEDLAQYIRLYETPIVISSKIEMTDPETLKRESKAFEDIIEGWRESWENKKIDTYMSYYSRMFKSGRKDWKQWRAYKKRLAKNYKKIRVDVDNLWILKSNGIVLASFGQSYSTSVFESNGNKRLYFRQNSKEWKITEESFQRKKKKPAPVKKQPTFRPSDIQNFIAKWEKAWEKKDLNGYISFYDTSFRSRGMDIRAWKKHREKLNQKYDRIEVNVLGLKIKRLSNNKVRVSFKQNYRADRFYDYGLKKILLIKRGKQWKIMKEDWRPLQRKSRS